MALEEVVLPEWVATVNDFQSYWFMDLGKDYEAEISAMLVRTWPRIQVAMNSSGQGTCTLALGMKEFLTELHVIIAGVMLNIAGVRISEAQRTIYNDMVIAQLTQIAERTLIICAGETSSIVPASGRVVYYG